MSSGPSTGAVEVPSNVTTASMKVACAGPEILDAAYRRLLTLPQLALTETDRDSLRKRGLSDAQIEQGLFRSFSRKFLTISPSSAVTAAGLQQVPGFRCQNDKWSFVCAPGLLIPVFNHLGQIVAIKTRVYRPGRGGKYFYATSSKHGGASPGTPVHVPFKVTGQIPLVRVTEGELKATIASHLSGVLTLSAPGVYGWRGALEVLQQIAARTVRIAYDIDAYSNPQVAQQLDNFASALRESNFTVELEIWHPKFGKGIDDVLAAGRSDEIRLIADDNVARELDSILKSAGVPKSPGSDIDDSHRREIIVGNNEGQIADWVIEGIKHDRSLFVYSGMVVRIFRDEVPPDLKISRLPSAPFIQRYPEAGLREMTSRRFAFVKETEKGGIVECAVPGFLIPAIIARSRLPFRRLEAVVSFPILRSDGTILQGNGYDPETCLFLECSAPLSVPEHPTRDEAIAAAKVLLDLVADFPFQKPEHQAAWLAFLLTLLARFAFAGPSPLFLIDANVRGSGKTLLAELVALIVLVRSLARMTNPESDEECRKRITALVIRGEMLVLIDNIVGAFGCGSLDAALTGTVWSDRILGKSETVEFPLNITWVASGNNVQIVADTSRRICPIRLQSPEENPENRTGFKFPNITEHVLEYRGRYLSAALTILRAHAVAGRPDLGTRAWGSFEGWSRVVRDALVWCGLPDPAKAREEFVQSSDRDAGVLKQLIAGWEELDQDCRGLTVAEVVQEVEQNRSSHLTLRNALTELCPPNGGHFNSRSIGRRLLQFRGRNCGGKAFDSRDDRTGVKRWRIITVGNAGFAGKEGFDFPYATAPEIGSAQACENARVCIGAETYPSNPPNPAGSLEEGEI